jgi:hypothetical protein
MAFVALEIYVIYDGVRTTQLGVAGARRARGTGNWVNG